ncbi:hypothetical protein DdX_09594 [Ditylenchus destructor]|uniref:Uncharacterized protein n=1 Tax=Ditylenchus destructor TaxID=166010 RepID=A0AAD4N2A6_9BILA|nr:hypothetical protein DdX_09594 [Ditylenchus destructor]
MATLRDDLSLVPLTLESTDGEIIGLWRASVLVFNGGTMISLWEGKIMDNQNISRRGVKRRRAKSPQNQNTSLQRKKVNILGDTWLEALKFMTGSQWVQKCFVSRQVNGVAQRNISRLPKMVLDSANMYYIYETERKNEMNQLLKKNTIVAFDRRMQNKVTTEWFKSLGYTLIAPKGISPTNLLYGVKQSEDKWEYGRTIHASIYSPAQEQTLLTQNEMRSPWFHILRVKKPVVYYAQLNPVLNQQTWAYLAQFLKFIYDPMSYIKKVEMFAVNQKFIDLLECNIDSSNKEPRYIRCESFLLRRMADINDNVLSESTKWLQRNVRAKTISIRVHNLEEISDAYWLLSNFLLDPSGVKQCASETMQIHVDDPVAFLKILIKKFRTLPLVESAIPTIEISFSWLERNHDKICAYLYDLNDYKIDEDDDLYMISAEQNRMKILFEMDDGSYDQINVNIYSV